MPVTNSIIEQAPLFTHIPVGQEVIYVVSNVDAVSNQTKVKFCAEVHISSGVQPNPSVSTHIIGTFKTTPNNAGVGIYDLRSIVENFVKADNMAASNSSYKGITTTNPTTRHPLHLIDKYSLNINTIRFMAIVFYVEYLGADNGVDTPDPNIVTRAANTDATSNLLTIFNGYLKYTDELTFNIADFGYDPLPFYTSNTSSRFLTNAPTTQYANIDDYGTVAFLALDNLLSYIKLSYLDSVGSALGDEQINRNANNGAFATWTASTDMQLVYFGCFPANLMRDGTSMFAGFVSAGTIDGGSIEIRAFDSAGNRITQKYTINLNCPNGKGYESVRLCWLNQWGAWDYYTFTKKSSKTLSTKVKTYTQLQGTWNQSTYSVDSFKGGRKAFRVNSTEKIKMNSDFVIEDDNIMFEELMNSPEVYLLEGYQTDITNSVLNQYVTPVRITTSSFTRKTVANDRLLQYTFEVEKTRTLRTQSI